MLVWGQTPTDLDSHLVGPNSLSDTTSRFHLYFSTLIVGATIIYSIVIHRWGDLFLYSLIFAGIMAILMAVVVVQDFCSSMLDKISML